MIHFITQPAPTIMPHVQADLDALTPATFLRWNDRFARDPEGRWDARWEIWIALEMNTHPDLRPVVSEKDVWNPDADVWMRFLQTYENEDGSFAPVDERLLVGLEMADTWANRHFYEDHVADPYEAAGRARDAQLRDAAQASSNYYRKIDSPIVGPYASSGWRWRLGL